MPGRESLRRQQYYAHPRNAFWPIVTELLHLAADDYPGRTASVTAAGFAIWDVLQACFRGSSLDSDILENTIRANDFNRFFRQHPDIGRVFFNGAKAESVYRRHVRPGLDPRWQTLHYYRLPSTSPAHAGMSREDKTLAWRAILPDLRQTHRGTWP